MRSAACQTAASRHRAGSGMGWGADAAHRQGWECVIANRSNNYKTVRLGSCQFVGSTAVQLASLETLMKIHTRLIIRVSI